MTGPLESQIPREAADVEKARDEVINATRRLQNLMLGPRDFVQSFTVCVSQTSRQSSSCCFGTEEVLTYLPWTSQHDQLISMQAITRFRLVQQVPLDCATFDQIACNSGLQESLVRRILRHAMTHHIFAEPVKGTVVHTAASRLLLGDAQLHDWVGASTDELWQGASQTVNALEKYPGSEEPNETGFALANDTNKSIYDFSRRIRPERQGLVTPWRHIPLAQDTRSSIWLDCKSLGRAHVVDVCWKPRYFYISCASMSGSANH